jgi:2-dehydro-3-deoxygluconokinase
MLRLDPGEDRIRTARAFRVWEGGGEYNVIRGLRKTFGHRTAIVTALPRNELGALCEDLILQGGVDVSRVLWRAADPVGRDVRMGLNFTERGFGVRAALGVSDRARSAASMLHPGEIDWDHLFAVEGVRWLHTGGIFSVLGAATAQTTLEAIRSAKRHGVVVSHDLNYRASLWSAHENPKAGRAANREIAALVDVLIGDERAIASCLGVDPVASRRHACDPEPYDDMVNRIIGEFDDVSIFAATLRETMSASRNMWGAVARSGEERVEAPAREIDILDRVGGGDAFASGLIHGLLTGRSLDASVNRALHSW